MPSRSDARHETLDPTGHDFLGDLFKWITVALVVVAIVVAVVVTAGFALGFIAPAVFSSFAVGMWSAALVGGIVGGLIGGTLSAATGGSFVQGFAQGFVEGFGMGAGAFALGWVGSALRGGKAFLRPPRGGVAESGSKAATAGDDAVKAADDILKNPKVLEGKVPADIADVINGAKTGGWKLGRLGSGAHKGQGLALRQVTPEGRLTGGYIRWHPGGGHHGHLPYWRVSDGVTRSARCRGRSGSLS